MLRNNNRQHCRLPTFGCFTKLELMPSQVLRQKPRSLPSKMKKPPTKSFAMFLLIELRDGEARRQAIFTDDL